MNETNKVKIHKYFKKIMDELSNLKYTNKKYFDPDRKIYLTPNYYSIYINGNSNYIRYPYTSTNISGYLINSVAKEIFPDYETLDKFYDTIEKFDDYEFYIGFFTKYEFKNLIIALTRENLLFDALNLMLKKGISIKYVYDNIPPVKFKYINPRGYYVNSNIRNQSDDDSKSISKEFTEWFMLILKNYDKSDFNILLKYYNYGYHKVFSGRDLVVKCKRNYNFYRHNLEKVDIENYNLLILKEVQNILKFEIIKDENIVKNYTDDSSYITYYNKGILKYKDSLALVEEIFDIEDNMSYKLNCKFIEGNKENIEKILAKLYSLCYYKIITLNDNESKKVYSYKSFLASKDFKYHKINISDMIKLNMEKDDFYKYRESVFYRNNTCVNGYILLRKEYYYDYENDKTPLTYSEVNNARLLNRSYNEPFYNGLEIVLFIESKYGDCIKMSKEEIIKELNIDEDQYFKIVEL